MGLWDRGGRGTGGSGKGRHRIGRLFEQDKLTPGPQVPHLEVWGWGEDGYGKQALASPGNSAPVSPGQAQAYSALRLQSLIAGIEELGEKGPVEGEGGPGWPI